MILHAYTQGRNESYMLPHYLRHYLHFCEHVFFIDDGSDDGTREIVQAEPRATLLEYGFSGVLSEHQMGEVYGREWARHSRGVADWVLFSDTDEFIYHPDLRAVLAAQLPQRDHWKGRGIFRAEHYEMLADAPPQTEQRLVDVLQFGIRNSGNTSNGPAGIYDKHCVVNPALDVVFGPGRHSIKRCQPATRSGWCGLKMLHYRYLGMEYMRARTARIYGRFGSLGRLELAMDKAQRRYDFMRGRLEKIV